MKGQGMIYNKDKGIVAEDIEEIASEEIAFVKLAEKFRHHYHESEINKDLWRPTQCSVCEALQLIETGRDEVYEARDEKNRDYGNDNLAGIPF